MPQKVVMEIPANPMLGDLRKRKRKLRVAAYCRVSTEEDEQQNSFEVQVDYYTEKITHHDGWQLAGIFADDGISGVRTKKRDQFNEMIELCRKKKIDLILTKSISRFARNTLDCIKHVRILKSWGIPVIFEKENIDTSNMNSEMILTCLSSFAQAESESISGNVTKGIRMGYKQGRFAFRYTGFAFQKGLDGEPEIIPKDAQTILMITREFLNGGSLKGIKEKLEKAGIPSPAGEPKWTTQTIQRILQNEKYAGDVLLQKPTPPIFWKGKSRRITANCRNTTFRITIRLLSQEKCFSNSGRTRPKEKQKACQHQEGQNQPWQVYQQIRSIRKAGLWGLRMLFPQGNMEYSRKKANRLAVHQPAGVRTEILREFAQP